MTRKPQPTEIDESRVRVACTKKVAVGVPAVLHALQIANEQMGVRRSVQTLLQVNQKDGFDCAAHSVPELQAHDDWWLGQQGPLTHPMILDDGATHYRPISWDAALRETATALRGQADPDEAIFYTPGRTSNEAAFLYQLLVRGFGTSRRSPNRNSESTVCDQTDRLNSGRQRGSRGIHERVHQEATNVCTSDGATCRAYF
jgi:anaerobic selenocysteine-containing dehydrogenase